MNGPADDEVRFEVSAALGVVKLSLIDATDAQISAIFTPAHMRAMLPVFARIADLAEKQMPVF
jgi:hypothetical protein